MYMMRDNLYTWQLQIFANTDTCVFITLEIFLMHLLSKQSGVNMLHKSSTGADCNSSALFIIECTQIWERSPQAVQFPLSKSLCPQVISFNIYKSNVDHVHAQQVDPANLRTQVVWTRSASRNMSMHRVWGMLEHCLCSTVCESGEFSLRISLSVPFKVELLFFFCFSP